VPQVLVQLVLVELAAIGQRVPRGAGDLLERLARPESVVGGEPLDLLAELGRQVALVVGDQGAPVARDVTGRDRVDGAADGVGHDDLARVDRAVVRRSGDALRPRGDRQQRRVAREVRDRAGHRLAGTACGPRRQPGPGQAEGGDLVGVHGGPGSTSRATARDGPDAPPAPAGVLTQPSRSRR
jgi:hypothetical protein